MKKEKDVYGCELNTWHDTSFEKNGGDSFAYSTKNVTVMYGKDLDKGGYFSAYTKEKYFMEFAPEKSYKHKTMQEAKTKALKLLSELPTHGRADGLGFKGHRLT